MSAVVSRALHGRASSAGMPNQGFDLLALVSHHHTAVVVGRGSEKHIVAGVVAAPVSNVATGSL